MFTLFKKTIASVIADFEQKAVDLEKLANQHLQDAVSHMKALEQAAVNKGKAEYDAARATGIAVKIRELIQ